MAHRDDQIGKWSVKQNNGSHGFANGFAMLVSCCIRTHTLMPAWQAEQLRETS